MLFYGIFNAINLTFLIKRVFNFLTISQIKNLNLLNQSYSSLFIRNQNFMKQQNTATGVREWKKNKFLNFNDF